MRRSPMLRLPRWSSHLIRSVSGVRVWVSVKNRGTTLRVRLPPKLLQLEVLQAGSVFVDQALVDREFLRDFRYIPDHWD